MSERCRLPTVPFVDAHHHLFPEASPEALKRLAGSANDPRVLRARSQSIASFGRYVKTSGYVPARLLRDAAGCNLVATVHVEAGSRYDKSDPSKSHLAPVGESRFLASVRTGGVARGVVARVNLTLSPDEIREAVAKHVEALASSGGLLCGVRIQAAHDPSGVLISPAAEPGVLMKNAAGCTYLSRTFGLPVDVWIYAHQLAELDALAAASPESKFVLDHFGTPKYVANGSPHSFEAWRAAVARLAQRPNVFVKLGGLGMKMCGTRVPLDDADDESPPTASSESFARMVRPYVSHIVSLFPDRCMWESNFPMDSYAVNYTTWLNAAFVLAAEWTPETRRSVFHECANRLYRLGLSQPPLEMFDDRVFLARAASM